jgi:hypothetical protein
LVVIVAAAFVVGRVRVGDWNLRRDGVVLVAIAVMGLVGLLVVQHRSAIVVLALSSALTVAGAYLMANTRALDGLSPTRARWLRVAAAGAIAGGLFGIITALFPPPS